MSLKELVEEANRKATESMMESDPYIVDVKLAKEHIPELERGIILHAGPPITWDRMCGPLKGAIIGGLIYEGIADTPEHAERIASRGDVVFKSNHEFGGACPMTGVVTPSMPILIVQDRKFGNYAFSNLNEGIGKVLRFGAYDEEVIKRLEWMRDELFPALKAAIREAVKDKGGIPIKPLIAQGLHMGDEGHNRHAAITKLFLAEITPYLIQADLPKDTLLRVYNFIKGNILFTLNITMAAAKAMTLAAHNIKYSTIVTVLSRNGTEVGIWVSGLGSRWFTAPAPVPKGLFFPGYTQEDANPDIGDSSITETAGFGGFAMAAAPAIVSWVGGSVQYAIEVTRRMYQITYTKHRYFTIPYLEFQGTPTGIDIRYVLKMGITPIINTGIAHKKAGIGQIGAGVVSFPMEPFKEAFKAFVEIYGV